MAYNYFYELKNGTTQKWASYLNQKYIDLNGVPLLVFRMDKLATPKDPLYGEESHSRYYTKPIEIFGLTLDPTWKQVVGFSEVQLYQEVSDAVSVVVNFENMVTKNISAKKANLSSLTISYGSTGIVSAYNSNNIIGIVVDGSPIAAADIRTYDTTDKLFAYFDSVPGIIITKTGENSPSFKIPQFGSTVFTGNFLQLNVRDTSYDNVSDVFEKGDAILTPNNFLFEIDSNITTGEFGWDYSTYTMMCSRMSLENIVFPDGYGNRIYRQDGRLEKINRDGYQRKFE
jgi:hypothetical protein